MYFIDNMRIGVCPVVDTKDWVAEYLNQGQLSELKELGVAIYTSDNAIPLFSDSDYIRSNRKIYSQFKYHDKDLTSYLKGSTSASIVTGLHRDKCKSMIGVEGYNSKVFDYTETDGFIILALPVMYENGQRGIWCMPIYEDGSTSEQIKFVEPYTFGEYPCVSGSFLMRRYGAVGLFDDELYLHVMVKGANKHDFKMVR